MIELVFMSKTLANRSMGWGLDKIRIYFPHVDRLEIRKYLGFLEESLIRLLKVPYGINLASFSK